MRYILAPFLIIGAIAMMKYTVQVTNFTGKMDFAERYLTYPLAGTYSMWRIFGVLVIVLSMLWVFGFLNFIGA